MITVGSFTLSGLSDQDRNEVGIPYSHAYSVLEAIELSTGDKIVAIRNPWGSETFNGTWGDKSTAWTDKLRIEADHISNDDGKFFISI